MNLDGRRVAEVLGDDWIVNDGGETTIVVNNVKLHDGATGATGLTAPNGARDVLIIQAEGVTVDRSTGAWVVSQRSAGVIADRDFSADDFTESSEPETPEEPTEEPKTPGRIIEVYAPRAAVYEALPGLLLGLTGGGRDGARLSGGRRSYGSDQRSAYDFKRIAADYESLPGVFRLGDSAGERLRLGGSPVWVRLSGGKGSYKSGEASVGAAYDFRRIAAEAGVDVAFPWNKDITGTVSVRHVQASAEVSSPTGGGDVDAKGFGAGLGVSWGGASGYYVDGRLSVTGYKLDLSSDKRGRLKGDIGALAHSLSLETGRRIALGTRMSLTPRARLVRSGVSMDRFTDAVNSRVKLTDAKQLKGVVGLAAETWRVRDGGSFSLRGSVDVERTLRGGVDGRRGIGREAQVGEPRQPGFCWVWAGSGAGAASRSASRRRRTARVRMSGNTPARSISESGSRAQSNEWNPTASPEGRPSDWGGFWPRRILSRERPRWMQRKGDRGSAGLARLSSQDTFTPSPPCRASGTEWLRPGGRQSKRRFIILHCPALGGGERQDLRPSAMHAHPIAHICRLRSSRRLARKGWSLQPPPTPAPSHRLCTVTPAALMIGARDSNQRPVSPRSF